MRVSKAFIDDMKRLGASPMFSVSHHNAIRANVKNTMQFLEGRSLFITRSRLTII